MHENYNMQELQKRWSKKLILNEYRISNISIFKKILNSFDQCLILFKVGIA